MMATRDSPLPAATTVLVTGGSGFIALHLITQLLSLGYKVRATIRAASREEDVRRSLRDAGTSSLDQLTFCVADLVRDEGWAEAVRGCSYVQHVASPFPSGQPKTEDELIVPARDGALRVLRAARDANVKRVVLTSSFAAVGYGHPNREGPFTEADWSVLEGLPVYHKSKTVAEKAAWDFVKTEGGDLELSVVNPTGVFGPVLSDDFSSSIDIIQRLMNGSIPACPQLYFGVVDVRDLADLHVRAMTSPAARGERFIGAADGGAVSFMDLANIIRTERPDQAKKVPTKAFPNWFLRGIAFFNPAVRAMVPHLGEVREASNGKAKEVLGWTPRPVRETVVDTADSLVQHGAI